MPTSSGELEPAALFATPDNDCFEPGLWSSLEGAGGCSNTAAFSEGVATSFPEGPVYSNAVDDLPPPSPYLCKELPVTGDQPGLLRVNDGNDPARSVIVKGKRHRSRNWTAEEKRRLLNAKVEALGVVKGKPDWEFIYQRLRTSHETPRSRKNCEDEWGTLLKSFKAIRKHESSITRELNRVSYWVMNKEQRSGKNLPPSFSMEWCKMIERILAVQKKRKADSEAQRKAKGILVHAEDSYGLQSPANLSGDGSDQRTQGEHGRISDPIGTSSRAGRELPEIGVSIEDDAQLVRRRAPFVQRLAPLVKQLVENAVTPALQSLPCRKRSGSATEDGIMTDSSLVPLIKQQVESAVNYSLQLLALTGTSNDEGDLMTRLAPFCQQQVKDALSSALQRVSLVLQVREKQEKEDEEKLRVMAERRRDLDREEKEDEEKRRVMAERRRDLDREEKEDDEKRRVMAERRRDLDREEEQIKSGELVIYTNASGGHSTSSKGLAGDFLRKSGHDP